MKMFACAEAGDLDGVIQCLEVNFPGYKPLDVNSMNFNNHVENLLSVFLGKQRNFAASECLIKLGAEISRTYVLDEEKGVAKPIFYVACERKDDELMKFLVSHKVNISLPCSDKSNVLTLAVEKGYLGLTRWLSRTKSKDALMKSTDKVPLLIACTQGNLQIVRVLVEDFGADVNVRINFGFTPLHIAARDGSLPLASYLLMHGADPELHSIDDNDARNEGTPLDIARFYGHFNVARLIADPREDELEAAAAGMESALGNNNNSGGSSGSLLRSSVSGSSFGGGNLFQEIPGEPVIGECSICYENTELIPLSCCGHAFCRDCLNDWFTAQFDGFTHLRCPWNGCNGKCSWYDIIYTVHDRNRFEDFYLKKALRRMDDFRWCPRCPFGGFVGCKEAECLNCGYSFCAECLGPSHGGQDCANFYKESNESRKWIKENAKQCPNCKALVYKDGGCSHIRCLRCNYEFCWICLGPYIGKYTFDDFDPCGK